MEVEIHYFDDCPGWRTAHSNVWAAMQEVGRAEQPISLVEVTTHEQAMAMGFRGSPTILVDGKDAFPATDAPVGLACRLYRTPDGTASSPTVEQLVAVLR